LCSVELSLRYLIASGTAAVPRGVAPAISSLSVNPFSCVNSPVVWGFVSRSGCQPVSLRGCGIGFARAPIA